MEQGRGPKKKTLVQIDFLKKVYSEDKNPNQKDMENYAATLNLAYNQVSKWFTDRRRKEKRDNDRLTSIKRSSRIMENKRSNGKSRIEAHGNYKSMEMDRSAARVKRLLQKKPLLRLQVLFPKDYILKKVFREDGPPLGIEFDYLPAKGFSDYAGMEDSLNSSQNNNRISKKQKICEASFSGRQIFFDSNPPIEKYGVGKGLMTVWRTTKTSSEYLPSASFLSSKEIFNKRMCVFHRAKNQELSRTSEQKPSQKKRVTTSARKQKMLHSKDAGLQLPHLIDCKLAVDSCSSKDEDSSLEFVDDEELELSELQLGSSPPRCSAHLASGGRNDCPLCKDMLARFPPPSVRMKQPIHARPWDSSPQFIKKLFKVLRFLYAHASIINICPFTLDELAQAFHDKDSMLLGKIHVALLKLLISDVERELSVGISPRTSKDCRFRGFLHAVRQQEFDVNFWNQSLNPLTWVEILRQVLISAGFAIKMNSMRRTLSKESHAMARYGLRPRTLKGELYSILSEKGSVGSKVAELAKASQIISLELCTTLAELELLICSTLSSDCTLFEKIGTSAYRLRISSAGKGTDDSQSDTDCGSIDDDSGDSSQSSSGDESSNSELDTNTCKQPIVMFKKCRKRKNRKLIQSAEIDESFSGEAWLHGLMEGEYSDLSIEEKLEALEALVDLTSSCSGLRIMDRVNDISTSISDMRSCGSGGKIKKALPTHDSLSRHSLLHMSSVHPSPPVRSTSSNEEHLSVDRSRCLESSDFCMINNSETEETKFGLHTLQSICLGLDRRYNSYWLFLGPCTISDPGHRRVYFESSEDGHWEVIDTEKALLELLSVLDGRGIRESHLLSSLKKREKYLCQAMSDFMYGTMNDGHKLSHSPYTDIASGESSSPLSDVDNNLLSETTPTFQDSGAIVLDFGKNIGEKKQKWNRLQAFDKWIWSSFCSNLNAVKLGKRSYLDMLVRCESCHDLYWRDEKHCRICHTTFELDFDLEEKYAVHLATCRNIEDISKFPSHRVLPSQLQALKASLHAVEASMPEDALSEAWKKSAHKLWVKRLRRTSSMPELIQVIADFVGAIHDSWLYECSHSRICNTALDDVAVLFQTMPQSTSAVALWLVKLDSLIAPHLQRLNAHTAPETTQVKRRRGCT